MASERPRVHVESKSGSILVLAVLDDGVEADGGSIETLPDGEILVRAGSRQLEVRCARGADVVVGSKSGSVDVRGEPAAVRVTCGSGSIDVEHAASLDARTASGSVTVGECEGDCRVVVASGSVRIGSATNVSVAGVSGSVHADDVRGADVKTVSGTISIGVREPGRVVVRSVSGTVDVVLPAGCAPEARLRSVSGSVRSECERGADGEVDVKTVSGTIRLRCR